MATVAATKGAAEAVNCSVRRVHKAKGSRSSVATENEDQRKTRGSWLRLAKAFQAAWSTAAPMT